MLLGKGWRLSFGNATRGRALPLPRDMRAQLRRRFGIAQLNVSICRWAWHELARLIKYGLVGVSNTLVSVIVLNLFFFLWPPASQGILVSGSTIAFVAGSMNSYWWNARWVFRAQRDSLAQLARFSVVAILCLAFNAVVVWGSAGYALKLPLPGWLIANAYQISMFLAGTLGYLACRLWVFESQPTHVL